MELTVLLTGKKFSPLPSVFNQDISKLDEAKLSPTWMEPSSRLPGWNPDLSYLEVAEPSRVLPGSNQDLEYLELAEPSPTWMEQISRIPGTS